MTFSINVKELPEGCFKNAYYSKSKSCYSAYKYNLKYTKSFVFSGDYGQVDRFEIDNKYSVLIITTSLKDRCTIYINKNVSDLDCRGLDGGSSTLLIKCEKMEF
jgi:hypothetical protein